MNRSGPWASSALFGFLFACDSATGGLSPGRVLLCGVDERVVAGVCSACPPGTRNAPGDDTGGVDTVCDPVLCAADERVDANACLGCPPGTENGGGDEASGPDTDCDPVSCIEDERVISNTCTSCMPGSTNASGDDASGPDTSCDPIICGPNQFVSANECRDCPEGSINEEGDDASGSDTMCASDACTQALGVSCERFEEAYLKASNTTEFDFFGISIALDEDTLAVGAALEDSVATGVNGDQSDDSSALGSGAVYVFTRDAETWRQEAYIKASNTGTGDRFGVGVALDEDILAVGAPGEDSAATGVNGDETNDDAEDSGAVYVFTRSGTTWRQEAYIKASNTGGGTSDQEFADQFGATLALDDDTLAVGAADEDSAASGVDGDQANDDARLSGAVYVFLRTGTSWRQEAYLKASNTDPGDSFGSDVALDGDALAVAATGENSAATGVNGDQTSNGAFFSGAVYVFRRLGATWQQEAYLKASNTESGDRFGSSVALHGDTLAVGAQNERSAATGVDGDQTNNDLVQSGAVYVFRRSGSMWRQSAYLKASNADNQDQFGVSVALDGDILAVGATESSAATGVNGDQFNNDALRSGAVYLFARSGMSWRQQAYVKASNPDPSDSLFDLSLALYGDTLAFGLQFEDSAATGVNGDPFNNDAESSGAVYVRRIAQ
ncbi:MAG: integrin [Myxococcota bacterium]